MPGPEALRWRSWPLRDEWPASLPKLLLLAGIVALFVVVFGPLGWLAAALLPLSLARWFLPTAYELAPTEIATRFCGLTARRPLSKYRRFYPHAIGVHLSTFEAPSPLDPFRGMFVRFGGNREAVLERLVAAGLRKGSKVSAPGSASPPPEGPTP